MVYDWRKILDDARNKIDNANNKPDLDTIKTEIFGNHGIFRNIMDTLASCPVDERPVVGRAANECKNTIKLLLQTKMQELDATEDATKTCLSIDPTLTCAGKNEEIFCHPLSKIRKKIINIFSKLGFSVAEGTELETEWFCFDALNTSAGHPSRDERDTFYFGDNVNISNVTKRQNERYLLRTHTSTVQIRTMLTHEPPIRILSPGLVFRKDTMDATHCPNFHQCEGLVIEDGSTVCDLKATLDFFFKELIGSNCEIRIRASYFPFVSPGFEVDLRSRTLGKLSDRWIEIAGCGMVAPNVLKNCRLSHVTGFAFGMGIERLAMLLYGIEDIRLFFQNDTRVLKQFTAEMMA